MITSSYKNDMGSTTNEKRKIIRQQKKTAQQEETVDSSSETSVHIESDSDLEFDEPVQQQPASEDATCLFCDSLVSLNAYFLSDNKTFL